MAQISADYGRKIKFIKSKLPKRNFYTMHEFFLICPFTHDELKIANRSRERMQWRQLGMVWACLCGDGIVEAGNKFNKDHATVVYSQQMIIDALDGYHPLLMQKLSDVLDAIEIQNTNASDFNTAFIISARNIERMLINRLKRLNQI